jgi:Flp pilus assembly protein TadD
MQGKAFQRLMAIVAGFTLLAGAALASGEGQMSGGGGDMGMVKYPAAIVPDGAGGRINPAEEYRHGMAALRAGKYRDAVVSFDRLVKAAPRDSSAWTLLGLSKEGAGDLKGAHAAYESAVRFNAGNVGARQQLGVTAARLGQTDQAQAALAELQKRAAACGACADAARLKAAIAAVQGAITAGPGAAPKS